MKKKHLRHVQRFNNLHKVTGMCLTQNIVKMSGCRVRSQQTMDDALKLFTGIELEWITVWREDTAASQAGGSLLPREAKRMLERGSASIQCFL